MKKIAITGNIAVGKSCVESIIAKSYPVYDTDKIAHKILDSITEFYGYDVFTNGKIDRKKLGNLVFKNPDVKSKLEELVHPQIKSELTKIFSKHIDEEFVFVSVPLLFEVKWEALFDAILIVVADDEIRLNRLMNRNSLTKNEALNRMQSQIAQHIKIIKCDFVIENNSNLDELTMNVNLFLNQLKNAEQ